jgi:hypothetical protein
MKRVDAPAMLEVLLADEAQCHVARTKASQGTRISVTSCLLSTFVVVVIDDVIALHSALLSALAPFVAHTPLWRLVCVGCCARAPTLLSLLTLLVCCWCRPKPAMCCRIAMIRWPPVILVCAPLLPGKKIVCSRSQSFTDRSTRRISTKGVLHGWRRRRTPPMPELGSAKLW